MTRSSLLLLGIVLATLAAAARLFWTGSPRQPSASPLEVSEVLGSNAEGFAQADRVIAFDFPRDHGSHPDFRNEWWYFTGNVANETGRPFGYQLTFFRTALAPASTAEASDSRWRTRQMYMAHATLSDVAPEQFHAFERLSRGALGLAGAASPPFAVWLENWSARSEQAHALFPMRLTFEENGVGIDLELFASKPRVLQGDRGLSAKSRDPGHASYYYSYTRLETRGTITLGDSVHRVQGTSWLDREWGSSALGRTQVGWDWFAIQLDDGSELMLAQVRENEGRPPFEGAAWIRADGGVETIADGLEIEVRDHWQSDATGARYPSAWRVAIPTWSLALEVTPAFAAQELELSIRYWEGATRIHGVRAGRAVTGVGYTELTGYARTR